MTMNYSLIPMSETRDILEYERLKQMEPAFRQDVQVIACQSGGELAGLDHSIKPYDSYLKKTWRQIHMGRTPEVDDVVRFTVICSSDELVKVSEGMLNGLLDRGYQIYEVDNKFARPTRFGYMGLHVVAQLDDDTRFEIQIHTPESFLAKNMAHPLYEEVRGKSPKDDGARNQTMKMKKIFESVSIPKGADQIRNPHAA